jgi:hypothetical protein
MKRAKQAKKARKAKKESHTMSIPEAGQKYYGLSRNGSYAAAERGDLPFIEVGRLKRVPVRAMEERLDQVRSDAGKRGAA